MIGMGSVVTRNVPPLALAVGNPARPAGWLSVCGHPLLKTRGLKTRDLKGRDVKAADLKEMSSSEATAELRCERCSRDYLWDGATLRPKAKVVSAP
jgi:acyl-[acyl carrier protein]--UDP-N-acetylglucosamine O-acyltransferase